MFLAADTEPDHSGRFIRFHYDRELDRVTPELWRGDEKQRRGAAIHYDDLLAIVAWFEEVREAYREAEITKLLAEGE